MKTIRQHIRNLSKDEFLLLKGMCQHSNSLYNSTLYVVNKFYEETNSYIGYTNLYHQMKTNIHYSSLPAKISQQILRLVDKNYNSFFSLLKQKAKGSYQDKISKPKYKKPNQEFILILPSDQISLIKGKLKITKNIKIPFTYNIDGKIKQIIIKPNNHNYYTIYIQYEENLKTKNKPNQNNLMGIDLGLNNLATCTSNVGHSFILNGKPLKSYNNFYNKQVSKIKSELKICNNKYYSKKLSILDMNRNNYIHNYFNQGISQIIKYCLKNDIGKIVIGYNESWKQEINLGKKNNQSFTNIPHFLFKQKLKNKCDEYGIEFILTEESYTSKTSFLDNEDVMKHDNYQGKRIKRGLFKSSKGTLINADVNGSLNIIRKVFPKFNNDGILGNIVTPVVLNIFNQQKIKMNFT